MATHKVLLEVPRLGGDPSGRDAPILLTDGPPAWWARLLYGGPHPEPPGRLPGAARSWASPLKKPSEPFICASGMLSSTWMRSWKRVLKDIRHGFSHDFQRNRHFDFRKLKEIAHTSANCCQLRHGSTLCAISGWEAQMNETANSKRLGRLSKQRTKLSYQG